MISGIKEKITQQRDRSAFVVSEEIAGGLGANRIRSNPQGQEIGHLTTGTWVIYIMECAVSQLPSNPDINTTGA